MEDFHESCSDCLPWSNWWRRDDNLVFILFFFFVHTHLFRRHFLNFARIFMKPHSTLKNLREGLESFRKAKEMMVKMWSTLNFFMLSLTILLSTTWQLGELSKYACPWTLYWLYRFIWNATVLEWTSRGAQNFTSEEHSKKDKCIESCCVGAIFFLFSHLSFSRDILKLEMARLSQEYQNRGEVKEGTLHFDSLDGDVL